MAKSKDPGVILSGMLVAVLRAQRDLGPSAYPVPLSRLLALTDPGADPELTRQALGKAPFKSEAVVAVKDYPESPVVLKEDVTEWAGSDGLLELALERVCTETAPVVTIAALQKKLDSKLKQPFAESVMRRPHDGFPSSVGTREGKKQQLELFLTRMPPPPPPKKEQEIQLSKNLVHVLKAQRDLGSGSYPLPFERLATLATTQADSEILREAIKKKPFKEEAVIAIKGNLQSPVVLRGNAVQLAESSELLEQLLELTCTEASPVVTLTALQTHLEASLKKPFKEATERRIQEQSLPKTVSSAGTSKKPLLFLVRMPPSAPPPPPKKPEVQLAENLVGVLKAQRELGGEAYPLMLQQLVALTDTAATKNVVKKAFGQSSFKDQVVLGAKLGGKVTDCPVALDTDRELLAGSSLMLEFLLRPLLKPQSRTAPVAGVVKKAGNDLGPLVKNALDLQLEANTLPPSLGWMWISEKQHLFLMEDVQTAGRSATTARPVPQVAPAAPAAAVVTLVPVDFGRAFEDAFQRLNREHGNNNFVSLVELRQAVPVDRATFDNGLRELRLAGAFGLSAAEGRHGLTSEQQEAGITEEGTLLLYVSRKTP